jgi:hypothetical protein
MLISVTLPLPDFSHYDLLPLEAFACEIRFPQPGDPPIYMTPYLDGYFIKSVKDSDDDEVNEVEF